MGRFILSASVQIDGTTHTKDKLPLLVVSVTDSDGNGVEKLGVKNFKVSCLVSDPEDNSKSVFHELKLDDITDHSDLGIPSGLYSMTLAPSKMLVDLNSSGHHILAISVMRMEPFLDKRGHPTNLKDGLGHLVFEYSLP